MTDIVESERTAGYWLGYHDGEKSGRSEAAAEIERLRIENIQMRFALGYPMPADLEQYILPKNPFKCGVCDARAALENL